VAVILCLAVAVFYAIFPSAEIQPWAEDKPAKEKLLTMHEEYILPTVRRIREMPTFRIPSILLYVYNFLKYST